MKKHIVLRLMAASSLVVATSVAHAFLGIDSPWCMGDGGGTFC